MNFFRVSTDNDFLNLYDYDTPELREAVTHGGIVYWELDGMIGKIPNSTLRDVLSILSDYQSLMERHPGAEIPKKLGVIRWDQTFSPLTPLTFAEVPPLPLRN